MGSLVMHLCVSKKLKEKYHFSDKFMVGALMPDLLKLAGRDKRVTHYIEDVIEESGVKSLPNVLLFEQDAKDKITEEKSLGILSHLVADKVWFDEYIGKYAKVDANDTTKVEYLEYNIVKPEKEFRKDIYDDYTNINNYLAEKYDLDLEHIKNTLKRLSNENSFKIQLDNSFDTSKQSDFKNTFITKKDLDEYIDEAFNKSVIEINKILSQNK